MYIAYFFFFFLQNQSLTDMEDLPPSASIDIIRLVKGLQECRLVVIFLRKLDLMLHGFHFVHLSTTKNKPVSFVDPSRSSALRRKKYIPIIIFTGIFTGFTLILRFPNFSLFIVNLIAYYRRTAVINFWGKRQTTLWKRKLNFGTSGMEYGRASQNRKE